MKIVLRTANEGYKLYPDSAITLPGRPIVLPENASSCRIMLVPAFRVSRLGKGISTRYARKYVDAVTVAAILTDTNNPLIDIADNAVTIGNWMLLSDDADITALSLTASVDDESATLDTAGLPAMIEEVSRVSTLKNGDILMPSTALTLPLPSSSRLIVNLNSSVVINRRLI